MSEMAASKSLPNLLPGITEFTLPVPSSLNWLMPYFVTMPKHALWKLS